MKKGCVIFVGSMIVLAVAGLVTIWILASQYEKQPKKPGEAELWAAEEFIRTYESSESSGNTPEAAAFADQFSRSLRVSRQFMFTEGTAGYTSSKHPEVKKLALGIKGALNYSSMITGTVNDKEPLKGIEFRHPTTSTKPLWPFFLTSKNQSGVGASEGE